MNHPVHWCPRCLGPVNLTPANKIQTHKRPNGSGFCRGSWHTIEEVKAEMEAENETAA